VRDISYLKNPAAIGISFREDILLDCIRGILEGSKRKNTKSADCVAYTKSLAVHPPHLIL